MAQVLKILLLEDSETDAEIVLRVLTKEKMAFEHRIVMDRVDYTEALDNFLPHLVLADNALPQFNATEALQLLNERDLHIPFILVTGTVSEEFAATIIKAGADDYILKDRLARLPASISAALRQRRTEKEKAETIEQLKENEQQLRELSLHLQDVREEERAALSREVHDELGQQLTSFKMDVHWVNKKLDNPGPEIRQKLESISRAIDNTIKIVRKIASDLRPSILDDLGLVAALEWHSEEFKKRSGILVHFSTNVGDGKIDPKVSIAIFRIYQELLTNVARHAAANKVEASLMMENNALWLTVSDDGQGFAPETISHKRTLGLLGMKERTLLLAGKYEISSNPGKGTKVIISLPSDN